MKNKYNWILPDAEVLAGLYYNEHRTTTEIAKLFRVTPNAVARKLKRHGFVLTYRRDAKHRELMSIRLKTLGINRGRKLSADHKRKISEANPWKGVGVNKGKTFTDEWKRKIGDSQRGAKGSNWRGGISFEPYTLQWTTTLRRSIRQRDEYICQICGSSGVIVHHIDYRKDNCDPSNLITLCHGCHGKTNFNRNKWMKRLNKIIVGRIHGT